MTGTTPGRPCLDLVATVHGRFDPDPLDDIATPAGLAGWLERSSLLSGATPDEADAVAYLAVREAVFRLLGVVTGTADAPRPGDVAVVDAHARGSNVGLALGTGGVLLRAEDRATPAQVLTRLARDAVDLLTGPDRDRLHQCEAQPCGSFYLDTSRAGRRRWCSSACGNRARVAAHRDRHRA
jgi:predicted RNA-binding Zn ribbon-like protein